MHYMPRLPIGERVADPKANGYAPRTTREHRAMVDSARALQAVAHYATKRELPEPKAPKRRRNQRPTWARDREASGPARTLHADEIRALGYATTKDEG